MTEPGVTIEANSRKHRGPRCPTCGRPRLHEYRPFCSARCRDIDLARWFAGAYAVPAVEDDEPADDGELQPLGSSPDRD